MSHFLALNQVYVNCSCIEAGHVANFPHVANWVGGANLTSSQTAEYITSAISPNVNQVSVVECPF